jgi:hypothetical protein
VKQRSHSCCSRWLKADDSPNVQTRRRRAQRSRLRDSWGNLTKFPDHRFYSRIIQVILASTVHTAPYSLVTSIDLSQFLLEYDISRISLETYDECYSLRPRTLPNGVIFQLSRRLPYSGHGVLLCILLKQIIIRPRSFLRFALLPPIFQQLFLTEALINTAYGSPAIH